MSNKNPFFTRLWKLIASIFGSKSAPVVVPPVVKPVPVPDPIPEPPVVSDPKPLPDPEPVPTPPVVAEPVPTPAPIQEPDPVPAPPVEVPVPVVPVADPVPPVTVPEAEVPVVTLPAEPVPVPVQDPIPPVAEVPPVKQPDPVPPVKEPTPEPAPAKVEYIKDFAPFPWGVAIKKSTTAGSSTAKQLLLEGDCFVTENGVGMDAFNKAEGQFNFASLDSMLKAVNGKPLYVFHIIWGHAGLPDFVLKAKGNRELVLKHFKNYIQTLVRTYKGKINKWVVVNEAFESNGTMKDCFWLQELGAEYIPLAFQFAHEANPDAELILNDYDQEYNNKKVPAIVQYVKDQVKAGVPIHGIGSQMHTYSGLGIGTKLKEFKDALKALVSTGVKIYISELDVSISNTPANIAIQRTTYLEIVKAYTEIMPAGQQGGIFVWSLVDDASYKNFDSNGKQYSPLKYFPALMSPGYVRKPVYDDILNYFKSLKK